MRRVVLSLALLMGCSDNPASPVVKQTRLAVQESRSVIVRTDDIDGAIKRHGLSPKRVFRSLGSFALDNPPPGLLKDPSVKVSEERIYNVDSWGLDRIDQRALPLSGSASFPNSGSGVRAYIIDTGINFSHPDFQGRASPGFDAFGGNGSDCNGHGTHVSGTTGGNLHGVAKGVQLVSVKAFPDCSGSTPTSAIMAGMDWVLANAIRPAVVNMSVGSFIDPAINDAVARLTAAGIVVVAAAGNSADDACFQSPASAPSAIAVGATQSDDARASYSNYGPCVDVFAPGSNILSTWWDGGTRSLNGTSMATPHVTGVAALVLSACPTCSPAQVDSTIKARATKGVVSDARSENFHLLYSGLDDDTNVPEPPPLPDPPAAPSNLVAGMFIPEYPRSGWSVISMGWQDNSSNEDGFDLRGTHLVEGYGMQGGADANLTSTLATLQEGPWRLEVRARNAGGPSAWISIEYCIPGPNYDSLCNKSAPPPPDTITPPPPPPDTVAPPCRPRGKSGKCK